ncbi:MAG: DUF996 domain-containing protein [Candidatus Bathyarchaeota archaeon]|nr:DUF996 domain-containing protein [Candidatus Bathyarchaeota archaeon]
MSLESNKTLGGVGAILLAIPIANLVGIILVLIAMKGMADHYQDDDIFKNALYGFIFGIIGVVALIAVGVMFFVTFSATIPSTTYPLAGLTIFILAFVTMYIFSLIGAIFYRKAFNSLSEKSNEKMFETAGLLLLIGAIIPVIGEILRFIAWILAAVGFFSIRVPVQATMGEPVTKISGENKFCQNCGAKNKSEASFCEKCGQKFN